MAPPNTAESRDPVLLALENAPLDDEPLTDEDRAAIEAARAEVRRGEVYTTEQVRRLLELDD